MRACTAGAMFILATGLGAALAPLLWVGCTSADTTPAADAGPPPVDGSDAATDAPPPDRCLVDSVQYADGAVNPTNPCQRCQLSSSSSSWSGFNDGATCASGKICHAGGCASGCWIDSTFYPADAQAPQDALHVCLPSISGTSWTDRVVIAAVDSSSDWQAEAVAICTGTNDELTINPYLTSGTMVELAPGTFNLAGFLTPESRTRLHGQGDGTVVNLLEGSLLVLTSVVELDHFALTGTLGTVVPAAVSISSSSDDLSDIRVHDINGAVAGGDVFVIYANSHDTPNRTISNVSFARCSAHAPDGFGFLVNGEGTTPRVENLTFFQCTVDAAGVAATRTNDWVTGIDFVEYAGLTVDKMQAIGCRVDGAWESDFHIEDAPTKIDFVVTDCTATNAGQKTGGAVYGAGFLLPSGDVVMSHNGGSNNANGDMLVWDPDAGAYHDYSPPVDLIIPAGSPKVATRISQGNCSGVEVTNGSRKTLILFSSDGNPVSQDIELGGLYTADDSDVYAFSGTQVRAEFQDYVVMRLVER